MRIGLDARWWFRERVNTQFTPLSGLLEQNSRRNFEHEFFLYTDNVHRSPGPMSAANVTVRRMKSCALRGAAEETGFVDDLWWFEKIIPKEIITDCIDVFVSPYFRAPRAQIPVVNMVHDLQFMILPEHLRPPHLRNWARRKFLAASIATYCKRVADHTITVSEYAKASMVRLLGISANRISVCYNGIDTYANPLVSKEIDDHRQPKDHLLYVGFNSPNKNLIGLLRAYALLPEPLRRVHPLILRTTPGSERKFIEARGLNTCVHYITEHLSKLALAQLMARSCAVVLVSFEEGFGLPPVEALALGVPVVVSAGGALSEVTGGSMVEVDPANPASIARGLQAVLEPQARSQLNCSAAREMVQSRFSLEQTASTIMEVIQGVMRKCAGRAQATCQ